VKWYVEIQMFQNALCLLILYSNFGALAILGTATLYNRIAHFGFINSAITPIVYPLLLAGYSHAPFAHNDQLRNCVRASLLIYCHHKIADSKFTCK
jgi:hypothetical protein